MFGDGFIPSGSASSQLDTAGPVESVVHGTTVLSSRLAAVVAYILVSDTRRTSSRIPPLLQHFILDKPLSISKL